MGNKCSFQSVTACHQINNRRSDVMNNLLPANSFSLPGFRFHSSVEMYRVIPVLFVLVLLFPLQHASAQVVYNDDIQPIFTSRCIACHGGTSGVTLSSYAAVMNSVGDQYGRAVVVPNQPDDSPIIDKIGLNPQYGDRMPQGGPYLSDAQIELIRQWIAEGALETPATSLDDIAEAPRQFELLGNYPNPFNPSTNVRFALPAPADWTVRVYTAAGRYVTSVTGRSQGGETTVPVNLESVSSGMYMYVVEITSSGPVRERKSGNMMLIK
jgi:mono/diheme cytochrome c family protein